MRRGENTAETVEIRAQSSLRNERGGVAAEFAITVPVILLVLGLVLGALMVAAHRISLVSAAGDIVRLEARGDEALAEARIALLPDGVSVTREERNSLLCVTLSSRPGRALLSSIAITGMGCAAMMTEVSP